MHWAMDHMDELEHAEKTASKAVKEEGERIEREMRACPDRIEGP